MSILDVSNIAVFYENVEAISSVSIRVKEGSITTVLGANGAGKSTLMSSVMGLVRHKRGEIHFLGENISRLKTYERVSRGLSLSPEGRLVFPELTVAENLRAGGYAVKDKAWKKETLDFVFRLFPRLEARSLQLAGSLSGGEQQMLAIGRALMAKPSLLLLDEPSLGIAPLLTGEIFQAISLVRKSGLSILLVEQNAMEALKISDYGYVLETGTVSLEGPAAELIKDKRVREAYLGG